MDKVINKGETADLKTSRLQKPSKDFKGLQKTSIDFNRLQKTCKHFIRLHETSNTSWDLKTEVLLFPPWELKILKNQIFSEIMRHQNEIPHIEVPSERSI